MEKQTMNKRNKYLTFTVVAVFMALTLLIPCSMMAQKKSPVIKIGTYDSRIITFAWSRSDYFKERMAKMGQQGDSANKAHDSARIKDLGVQAMSYQHLLHQMVFSNGSAGIIMQIIKDKLPELSRTTGVSVILSKWELNYNDPSFEIIDLTSQVAALFQPKENIDKMAADISAQAPVPLDELGIETDMLDLYCVRFGKK
ncbi:MAG: hypothetical protein ACOYNU_04295 [Bacteroidales bacterium]